MAREYAKEFYKSKTWKRTREAYIKSRHYQCERCMKEVECGERKLEDMRPARIVHHRTAITPENINNMRITLSWKNLEAVCDEHHNKEHKTTQEKRFEYNPDGTLKLKKEN